MNERPTKGFTYVTKNRGRYDWAHPKDYETCYTFHIPVETPEGLKKSFVVDDDDIDRDDALECARAIQANLEKYLYSSSKEEIIKLVQFLENREEEEFRTFCEWVIADAEWEIERQRERSERAGRHLRSMNVNIIYLAEMREEVKD